jgi:putative flippase GtrA
MHLIKRLTKHIPPDQLVRYLVVGVWNSAFGYGCFFAFTKLFVHLVPTQPSLMASASLVAATFVNVTVSFFGYKLFVFRTKGNAFREYRRSFLVYLPVLAVGAVVIAPLTALIGHIDRVQAWAPYIAGAILQVITVMVSFIGHKHVSFKQDGRPDEDLAA